MKYIILLILLIPAISATDIDFRVLTSDTNTTMPLLIDINTEEEFNGELEITVYDYEANPGSSMKGNITVLPDQKLFYINLTIEPEESNNDVAVYLTPENGNMIYALHNSIVRFDKNNLKNNTDLPPAPGQKIKNEIEEAMQEFEEKYGNLTEEELKEEYLKIYGEEETNIWPYILIPLLILLAIIIYKLKK